MYLLCTCRILYLGSQRCFLVVKKKKLPAQVPNLPAAQVPQTWRWHRKTSQSFQLETGTAAQLSPQAVPVEVHTSAQYSVVFVLAHLPTKEFVLMYVVGWRQYRGLLLQTCNRCPLCAMAVLVSVDSGSYTVASFGHMDLRSSVLV